MPTLIIVRVYEVPMKSSAPGEEGAGAARINVTSPLTKLVNGAGWRFASKPLARKKWYQTTSIPFD